MDVEHAHTLNLNSVNRKPRIPSVVIFLNYAYAICIFQEERVHTPHMI